MSKSVSRSSPPTSAPPSPVCAALNNWTMRSSRTTMWRNTCSCRSTRKPPKAFAGRAPANAAGVGSQPRKAARSGPGAPRRDHCGRRPRSYDPLFGAPAQSPWKKGEWLCTALRGLHDPRIAFMSAAMGEGSGPGGGFLVPEELARMLLDTALHQSIVMSRATISPMASKTKVVAGFAGTDQSQNLYGFSWGWLPEHAEAPIGSGTIRAIQLNAHVLGGLHRGESGTAQ